MSERRKIVDRMASVHYDAIDEGEQPWETLSFAFRFDVAEQFEPVYDAIVAPLLAEVERLRGELARQAEQITAVQALADDWRDFGDVTIHMDDAAADIDAALEPTS